MKVKFECPKCECDVLEEVMRNVTQSSTITDAEDGILDYGNISTDGGEVDRYQCVHCGHVIHGCEDKTLTLAQMQSVGGVIDDPDELVSWLKEHGMLEAE